MHLSSHNYFTFFYFISCFFLFFSFLYRTYFWGSILEALEPFLQARSKPIEQVKDWGPDTTDCGPAVVLTPGPKLFPFLPAPIGPTACSPAMHQQTQSHPRARMARRPSLLSSSLHSFFCPHLLLACMACMVVCSANNTKKDSHSRTYLTNLPSWSPTLAAPATLNYSNMPGNKTQYLAILQNNAYPFPIPAHVGTPSAYQASHAQPMPFIHESFYSPRTLYPLQLQQRQQQSSQHASHQARQLEASKPSFDDCCFNERFHEFYW